MYIKRKDHAIHLSDKCKNVPLDDPDMLAWEAAGGVFTTEEELEAHNVGRSFLEETDWKVLRHRDQLDVGSEPSLTDMQYQSLLQERQTARDNIFHLGEVTL